MFCRSCCRDAHQFLIYHRIEKWNGRFFQDASLWEVGVRLHIGHQGLKCPSQSVLLDACAVDEENKDEQDQLSATQYNFGPVPSEHEEPQPPPPFVHNPPIPDPEPTVEVDDQDDPNWQDVPSTSFTWVPLQTPTPTLDDHDNQFLLIVHSTGLLSLPVVLCSCLDADVADELLLDLELLPASYRSIKTAFTFSCLDDYRLSNLECKTSAYQYYQKLRRLTNPAFPHAVANRYNEFRRATRQWRNLKLRKWFGFGHRSENPGKGSLALFCAACPQPSVNLPTDFKTRYTKYVADLRLLQYCLFISLRTETMRSLVADGNFTADHIKQKRPQDDVWLSDGEGMMTAREPYATYIKLTKETKDVGRIYHPFNNLLTQSLENPLRPIGKQFQGHS